VERAAELVEVIMTEIIMQDDRRTGEKEE